MHPNRYRVTLGGLLFLLALTLTGGIAFLSGNNLLFLIFAAMMALLLVSGFLSRLVLAGLELELLLPEHLSARTPAAARVRIRNLKRFTASFSIELSSKVLTAPVYFPAIPGRKAVEAAVEVVFPMRGRHPENFFAISTRFPFGFIRKSTAVALHHDLLVYPSLAPHADLELLLESLSGELETNFRGSGRDFHRIRPYEPRDDARHVDWKSTAHTGSLQVREFTREDWRRVEVLFDRRISRGDEERFEKLIERAAFVVHELSLAGAGLGFRSQNFTFLVQEEDQNYDILRFLSLTEPIFVVPGNDQPLELSFDDSNLQIVFSIDSDAAHSPGRPDSRSDAGRGAGERIHLGAG